ncbi:MAG: VPLPA-CTERM sorting domain-containing protein [Gammaproteobacteria bacterium]
MSAFLRGVALLGAFSLAPAVNAATLDFTIPTGGFTLQSYTDVAGSTADDYTGSAILTENGYESVVIDVIGENLDIRIDDVLDGNPYFDADSGGKPGGLGSCRDLDGSAQCVPKSDDNLTIAAQESIRFDFLTDAGSATNALLGDFTFRDDDHNLISNGFIQVSATTGSYLIATDASGIGDLSVIGKSSYLRFNAQPGASDNYYITAANVSAIPVPAAVWLFGSALGALGWMRRRKTEV